MLAFKNVISNHGIGTFKDKSQGSCPPLWEVSLVKGVVDYDFTFLTLVSV